MMSGTFGLDDLISQMGKIRKMGPLKHIMKMMPGMGQMLDGVDMDDSENEMKRTEAIVQSMTAKEKKNPDLINSSRRRRIAQGCGRGSKDIQALLKQFHGMRKMMKGMAPMMGGMQGQNLDPNSLPNPTKGMSKAEIRKMRQQMMGKNK
jgi:signal recognition particle subunit SRP54